MGYEIVYCGKCQTQVRGVDLEKGQAIRVEGQAFCAQCAPSVLLALPPDKIDGLRSRPPRISSTRTPALSSSSTRAKTVAPAPNRTPLVAAAVAGIVVVIAILYVALGKESPPERAASTEPAPAPRAATALAALERAAASSKDPAELIGRCEETAPLVRGTPQEGRFREIQARAIEAKKLQDLDRSITAGLERVRSIRQADPTFEKAEEVTRLLDRMKELGGPRQPEIQKVIAEYGKDVDEAKARAGGMVAWYRFRSADALGKDDSGRGNDALSVEGPGWFGPSPDGGPGLRCEGKGRIAIPASIRADFTIAMRLRTRQDLDGVERHWWRGAGLVDGELQGSVEDFGTSLLGPKFTFGVGNPDKTLISKTDVNDGRWHHVAATRDGRSGEMKIYVDGALEGSMAGPKGDRTAPPRLTIGGLQTNLHSFVGDLEDVRLYSRVLPASEIGPLARKNP